MKINGNKEIFMEVRFEDLEPGHTFAIKRESGYTYAIKARVESPSAFALELESGWVIWPGPSELVVPVEIIGDAKWPDKVIRRQ